MTDGDVIQEVTSLNTDVVAPDVVSEDASQLAADGGDEQGIDETEVPSGD